MAVPNRCRVVSFPLAPKLPQPHPGRKTAAVLCMWVSVLRLRRVTPWFGRLLQAQRRCRVEPRRTTATPGAPARPAASSRAARGRLSCACALLAALCTSLLTRAAGSNAGQGHAVPLLVPVEGNTEMQVCHGWLSLAGERVVGL